MPLIAAEDTRHTRRLLDRHGIATRMTSYHAQSGAGAPRRSSSTCAAAPTSRWSPTPARPPSATRAASWSAPGRRRAAGSCRSRARRPCWPRSRPRRGRRRAGRSRASCRDRGASGASGSQRIAADERGHGPVRGAGPGRGDAARPGRRRAAPTGRGAVCRELTKLHETIVRGHARRAGRARAPTATIPPRGEFVVVVGAWPAGAARPAARSTRPRRSTRRAPRSSALVAAGVARGEAARRVAAATGLPRRRLYGARPASLGWRHDRRASTRSGLPILGQLRRWSRVVPDRDARSLSLLAIVLEFGLHADQTLLFIVVGGGDPRARLGGRPLDRAARRAHRAAGRRHPQRDVRQHRRADHRVLRPRRPA